MRLYADFQAVRDGTRVVASLRVAGGVLVPFPGVEVLVDDKEGHTCWGIVERVEGPLVHIMLDLATWQDATDLEMPRSYAGQAPVDHFGTIQSAARR